MWQYGHANVDLVLPADGDSSFDTLFGGSDLNYTESRLPNALFDSTMRAESVVGWDLSSLSNSTFHTAYRNIDEIGTFVKDLLDLYPEQVRLVPIGHSAESREMFALEISANHSAIRKKSGFVIAGTQHAREVCPLLP